MSWNSYDQVIQSDQIRFFSCFVNRSKAAILPFCTTVDASSFPYCSGLQFWAMWNGESDQSIHQSLKMSIWNLKVYESVWWRVEFYSAFCMQSRALSSDHDPFCRFKKWCCVVWL